MGSLNSIPLSTARDRDPARLVQAPRSMYGTGSSASPTNQKETPAETRQAHRHTMEAQQRREPEVIRIPPRKMAAIRILLTLHREAHIQPEAILPETETIRAAAMFLAEAAIQMVEMAMQMETMAMAAPTIRMEKPRKEVLISQMPMH